MFNAERKALQVMGLGPEATLEVVKAKYKALVKQHHPDANGGDRSTEDRLIEIIKAYNYLKTVVRGADYAFAPRSRRRRRHCVRADSTVAVRSRPPARRMTSAARRSEPATSGIQ